MAHQSESVTDLTKGVYRRLYSGFVKGQRINKLSLQAEAWFWRVMATVDDFGNTDAEPGLLLATTVGRRVGITLPQVTKWLEEMRESGLIQVYADESGDKYLHINGFEELQPAGKNGKRVCRFPRPGESRLIQNNPDFLNSSLASHSHSHTDTHTDTEHLAAQARRVFRFWQEHMGHGRANLDVKREKAITQRLKDGYSVADLEAAIRGCKLSPFNMGQNDRQEVYDGIDLICRDAEHVDRFMVRAGVTAPSHVDRREREAAMKKEMGWDRIPA